MHALKGAERAKSKDWLGSENLNHRIIKTMAILSFGCVRGGAGWVGEGVHACNRRWGQWRASCIERLLDMMVVKLLPPELAASTEGGKNR